MNLNFMGNNGKISILLVEDDENSRYFLKKCLEIKGFFVVEYAKGSGAIEDINNGLLYDVAIIDMSLRNDRDLCGIDVRNASKNKYPKIPVIGYSGYPTNPKSFDYTVIKGEENKLFEIIFNIDQSRNFQVW